MVYHYLLVLLPQLCGGALEEDFQKLDVTIEGVMNPFGDL